MVPDEPIRACGGVRVLSRGIVALFSSKLFPISRASTQTYKVCLSLADGVTFVCDFLWNSTGPKRLHQASH